MTLIVILASCSKDFLLEDPKGLLTIQGFFKNAADLELGLIAVYAKANGIYNQSQYVIPLMGADDVTTAAGSSKDAFIQFDTFKASSDNPWMVLHWNAAYSCIWAANHVIVNDKEAIDATQCERNEAAAKAHFCRAMSYYYLVRCYNEIPLITNLEVNLEIEKSGLELINDLIVNDLKFAEQYLPVTWEGDKKNVAPTKGAAKAQLASVYLSMAGYPLIDASKYALVGQKAKEVIDDASVYGYRLLGNFADLWSVEKFNEEMVFGLFYDNTIEPRTWSNGNASAPLACKPMEEGGWADYMPEINFFNNFPEGPRKNATFKTVIRPNSTTTLDCTNGVQRHPYYKKMELIKGADPEQPWVYNNWWSGRTNIVVRYAEVLLTYAESKAMCGSLEQTAYDALNAVRNRAGLVDLPVVLTQLQLSDSVVQERAWEFVGLEINPVRWCDLVRLEIVEEAKVNRHLWEIPIMRPPTKEDYFAPIPCMETNLNPRLK